MCRGRSGNGDSLGRVFLTSSDIGAAGEADRVEVGRRIGGIILAKYKNIKFPLAFCDNSVIDFQCLKAVLFAGA